MYKPPYVGVTGFTSNVEVQAVLNALPANLPRKLMIGVLANQSTLYGPQTSRFPKRYPEAEKTYNIFNHDPRVLNLIHYHTDSEGDVLAEELDAARLDLGGRCCHGLQVNIPWPDPESLRRHRQTIKNFYANIDPLCLNNEVIVLQVGREALEMCGYNPLAIANRLRDYDGIVNYALLDQSGGRGEPFTMEMAGIAMTVADQMPKSMGLVLAGGLSALSVDKTLNYFKSFDSPTIDHATLSIDAEGRLRSLNDDLIIDQAIAYVKRSLAALHVPAEVDEG